MNRTKGAMLILFITLFIVVSGFVINTKTTSSVSRKITLASQRIDENDISGAELYTDSAINEWNSMIDKMMIFSSHGKIDQTDESLNIAAEYLKNNETDMFKAECRRTLILLKHMEEVEYPTINNIL